MHLVKQQMVQILRPLQHVGDPKESPSSWLQSGLEPAVKIIWGVNQLMKPQYPSAAM